MLCCYDVYCQYCVAHHNKLEEMVADLSTGLTGIKHEQEYMEVRERIHRMSKEYYTMVSSSRLNFFVVANFMQWYVHRNI